MTRQKLPLSWLTVCFNFGASVIVDNHRWSFFGMAIDHDLVTRLARRCTELGYSIVFIPHKFDSNDKNMFLALQEQAAKIQAYGGFGDYFDPGYEYARELISDAVEVEHIRALMDFEYFTNHLLKNFPEVSSNIILEGEDRGLLEIRKPIGPGLQWFETTDKKAIFVCDAVPGDGNSSLQISEMLAGLVARGKSSVKVRPNCFRMTDVDKCRLYRERASWFGKPFSLEWVRSIQKDEKAEHVPNDVGSLYGGYHTQFFWSRRKNNEVHLSIEELPYKHTSLPNNNMFLVRFIHAIFNLSTNKINHLDGALHIYRNDHYQTRLDLHLADFYKVYSKVKIFRIDENLAFEQGQLLIEAFFRSNFMVREYFSSLEPLE